MKTIEEIQNWINQEDTWDNDLDGLDKIDVAENILKKCKDIIDPLRAELERLADLVSEADRESIERVLNQ